jgi:phage antirepressor YoqD-like protein
MASIKAVKELADTIIRAHGGQAFFNFGEISKIMGCGINTVPKFLYDKGVLVQKVGPSKRVSALELADAMLSGRKTPVD